MSNDQLHFLGNAKFKPGDRVLVNKSSLATVVEVFDLNFVGEMEYRIKYDEVQDNMLVSFAEEKELSLIVSDLPDIPCKHEDAYLNKIFTTLEFWFCPDCKKEVKGK
jgi:hypothetical protein